MITIIEDYYQPIKDICREIDKKSNNMKQDILINPSVPSINNTIENKMELRKKTMTSSHIKFMKMQKLNS